MKLLKRLCLVVTAVLAFTLLAPLSASAIIFTPTNGKDENGNLVPVYFYSQSIYMINTVTGEPIVDINGSEKLSPGYLTQLMTCALVLDKFSGNEKKLRDTHISADSEAFDELYETGAPTADIRPGEEVSYYDLLSAMILCSSCEAANIIAVNMADSIFDFTTKMNAKAKELGMTDTNFASPHGFFVMQNYSTAKDMCVLCRYLVNNYPVFKDIARQEYLQLEATDYHSEGTNIYNNNYMVTSYSDYYYSFADGMKSSVQDGSGRSLATYASYEGNNYLAVSLNAPIEKTASDVKKGEQDPDSIYGQDYVYYSMLDHKALYDWAFYSIVSTDFINPNSEITDAKVEYGDEADYVNLKPAGGCSMLWPVGIPITEVSQKVTVFDNIIAPVEKGDVLGKMELIYQGEVLSSIDLIATSGVKRSKTAAELKIASAFYRSSEFKWAIFMIIMVFTVYSVVFFIFQQLKYLKINNKKDKKE